MRSFNVVIGILLIVVAAVLLIGYRDAEFGWFRGQPLGIVLGVLGVFDLLDGLRRGRD